MKGLKYPVFPQIYDAGEVFGIMQYQQEDNEEDEENGEVEEEKKNNPGVNVSHKVIVTRDSGLVASELNRWGRLTKTNLEKNAL